MQPIPWATLEKDPVVRSAFLVFNGILFFYAFPILSPRQMVVFSVTYADSALLLVCIWSVLAGRKKIQHLEERRFWGLLLAFHVLVLSQELVYRLMAGYEWRALRDVTTDCVYQLAYLAVCLAATVKPHLQSGWSLKDPGIRFRTYGATIFAFGMLSYFVLIPHGMNPTAYRIRQPSLLLFMALDVFLVSQFGALAWKSVSGKWRGVYTLIVYSFGVMFLCDSLNYLDYAGLLRFETGTSADLLWYVPLLAIILAARARESSTGERAASSQEIAEREGDLVRARGSILLFYAFAFPILHFVLYGCGFLDQASRSSREGVVLVALVGIGILAALEHLNWQRKARDLQTDLDVVNEQLRQAQKMEAVGRLAGGVAHDFNNLLAIIMGYSEQMEMLLTPENELQPKVREVQKAAARAASLTQQLLTFSRKQQVQPQVLNLNAAVDEAGTMLRRLIGADIHLSTKLENAPIHIKADPTQVQQVILNLAVNARDAMPKGGGLTIETAAVELQERHVHAYTDLQPGPYVCLTVSDTGAGIPSETIPHIFEPFFTTKGMGKGTGLGLSTVYGIVRQSGGFITLSSELGKGSSFQVFLPQRQPSGPAAAAQPTRSLQQSGKETILVVEDEDALRDLVYEGLKSSGYQVLAARDAESAIRLSDAHEGSIHILVTDVIMPGLNGRELARHLVRKRRELRVLFVSGYSKDALSNRSASDPEMVLLSKPFSVAALRTRIREMLDAPGRLAPASNASVAAAQL